MSIQYKNRLTDSILNGTVTSDESEINNIVILYYSDVILGSRLILVQRNKHDCFIIIFIVPVNHQFQNATQTHFYWIIYIKIIFNNAL